MSNLYKFETIRKIEIDCTSYCNAFCGACDRNISGCETQPNLKLTHIDLETWKKIVDLENLQNINEIIFNGNFGDFSMHPHFIEMMEILANVKTNLYLNLNTNGGARSIQFWNDLAIVLNKFDKHDIKFGIDGLEDTHDLYRRGIDWNKRIENLKAFNSAGGNSIWKCIVFDYNKNSLDEISKFAHNVGCIAFQTNRNRTDPLIMKSYKDFTTQTLTSPTLDEFNKLYKRKDVFKPHNKTPASNAVETHSEIKCPYGEEGMIQIDPWGNVWPCCYISGRQIDRNTNFDYNKYSVKNNISYNSLTSIVEFIRNDLNLAWKNRDIDICNKCAGITKPAPVY